MGGITWGEMPDTVCTKSKINKFLKSIEVILSLFSDDNGIKLEINNKKNVRDYTNTWKLNNMLLNNQWVDEEIKKEI